MFQAIFNSLSGLFGCSESLDTISNNVANMNTPGFRGSRSLFRNIVGGGSGYGTEMSGSAINFMPGTILHTDNPTDLAINGAGYFILQGDNGQVLYTRAGQFHFNEDGYLVDSTGKNRIGGINDAGKLIDISIGDLRKLPPQATSKVNFAGNLSTTDSTWTVDDITVYDADGKKHALSVTFNNNNASVPNSWKVEVKDDAGNIIGSGEIRFGAAGSPRADYNTIAATLGSGADAQDITLNFGAPGTFTGTTQFSGGTSTIAASAADGHEVVGLQSWSFNESGVMQLKYANGETKDGPQVALAYFADETTLQAHNGGQFRAGTEKPEIGRAASGLFGKIQGASLEMSNVDLTQQFGKMIVIQRGYQASSRVLTVANGMLQQLYNDTRGG